MAKKGEKTFEENLASLKRGCIILGVLQAFSVISAFKGLSAGTGSALSLVISIVLLGMLYYILLFWLKYGNMLYTTAYFVLNQTT